MFQQSALSQNLLFLALIAVWGYFLLIRPQRQQQKKFKEMMANLKKNDEVVTTSGIHGTVAIIKEKTIVVRVDEGCRIEFDRESIASVKVSEAKVEVVK
ncbi:MAG: preprotein translocase subunit YajC [Candidatus Omnitrophica bacterium]|nr:preprotein translocase subunit YajC [Candidatus Omnitrophota bacterium]MDE2008824.1 preprotein translocase subunit YajC [Candidatus Omnitrophota bacterium]MDE2213613.1 preprotein translocase subunit YajC [Candidatus Omnitrophota bacterium]MDE2230486.1 preprotein translocase subunit YajC [Candidatus Omnitrophota bacterium]